MRERGKMGKMKSSILSQIENLRQGSPFGNKRRTSPPKFPELVENVRCHKTDEYPVVSAEDDSPVPPLACSFSKVTGSCHILALVDENGSVVLYDTNKAGDDAVVTDWSAHNNAVFDVKWMGGENKLITASGDQTVCLWDMKTEAKLLTFKGHTSSVRSVGFRPFDDAVFSSGSRDGHIRLWDIRCNIKADKVSSVHVIRNAHTVTQSSITKKKKGRLGPQAQDSQQSVTCVLFQDDNLLATGGAVDGCVKVWDIRKIKAENNVAVYSFPYSGISKRTHGYSSLVFDSHYSRLFANCTDDVIYCYDFISYKPQPVKTFKGHRNTSFYVKAVLSPDDQYLLSGSSDEHACIWQVEEPNTSPVILKGHRSEISDVAWCKTDLFRIVTASDDYSMRIWRFDPTAKIRKQKGHTDQMYNITGTAEYTHRDIGISTPLTPTISPRNSLKRVASAPVSSLELTPKRPKQTTTSALSPSIKTWLKRRASDSQEPAVYGGVCKKPKLIEPSGGRSGSVKRSASEMDEDENVSSNVDKRLKTDDTDTDDCKRTVIKSFSKHINSDETHNKTDLITQVDETVGSNKENKPIKADCNEKCGSTLSPVKDLRILKNIDTNSSPEKSEERKEHEVYTPVRSRMFEINTGEGVQSPTANLPNLVVDGPVESPRHTGTDQSKSKKKVDWLTEMRIQKLSGKSVTKSPGNKHCSRSLLDKLNSSVKMEKDAEIDAEEPVTVIKPKTVSPVKGSKSITSFFRRVQNT